MSLQELPEVPAKAPTSEDLEDLDLPDVPTKAPVASEVVETKAQNPSSASKGYIHNNYLFLLINATQTLKLSIWRIGCYANLTKSLTIV